ncbi:hypothetical protein ACFLVO_05015 [Chloroflexota bacterium]
MPSKSQHSRRKHSFQGKKKKDRRSPPSVVAQHQADTQGDKPVAPPEVVAPSISAPTPLTTIRYPYVITELRRIGILAGIMLAILVVLALVLS